MKVIDLTRPISHGQPGVEIHSKYTKERDGWNARTYHLYSHSGTHLDAPAHFLNDGITLDEIPIDKFIKKGQVIDLTHLEAKSLIEIHHVSSQFAGSGQGTAILLKTGWSEYFEDHRFYRDNFPRISRPLAEWIVEQKIEIVGVESPSVADVNNLEEVTQIHEILLSAGLLIVEGLVNLENLPQTGFQFSAIPLNVSEGDGSPCRAFAEIF